MGTHPGIVQRIMDGKAEITVSAAACCSGCSKRGACGIGTLAAAGRHRELHLAAPPGLQAGDAVTVSIEDHHLLPAALLGYLLPAVLLIAGAVAGEFLGVRTADSELWAPAGALLGLAVGLALIRWLPQQTADARPRIVVTPGT